MKTTTLFPPSTAIFVPSKSGNRVVVSICARFGVQFLGKQRGTVVSEHIYRDEDNHPVSRLRRYEDGSGRWYYFVGGKWKLGLGGRKRIPYNLPNLRAADVVIITEGEKKADIVSFL